MLSINVIKKNLIVSPLWGGYYIDMSLRDSEDRYVCLSSLMGERTFPKNSSSDFENRIIPIYLDPKREYEVGLSNILFLRYFYCISQNDPNAMIAFYGRLQLV